MSSYWYRTRLLGNPGLHELLEQYLHLLNKTHLLGFVLSYLLCMRIEIHPNNLIMLRHCLLDLSTT
jgi:hypothetical protein